MLIRIFIVELCQNACHCSYLLGSRVALAFRLPDNGYRRRSPFDLSARRPLCARMCCFRLPSRFVPQFDALQEEGMITIH